MNKSLGQGVIPYRQYSLRRTVFRSRIGVIPIPTVKQTAFAKSGCEKTVFRCFCAQKRARNNLKMWILTKNAPKDKGAFLYARKREKYRKDGGRYEFSAEKIP